MQSYDEKNIDVLLELLADVPYRGSELFPPWREAIIALAAIVPYIAIATLRTGGAGFVDGVAAALAICGYKLEYDSNGNQLRYIVTRPNGSAEVIIPEHPFGEKITVQGYPPVDTESMSIEEADRIVQTMKEKLFIRPRL